MFKLFKGKSTDLSSIVAPVSGGFYITTDTYKLHVGIPNDTGVELCELNKDIHVFASKSAFESIVTNPIENGFYYLEDTEKLYIYSGGVLKPIRENDIYIGSEIDMPDGCIIQIDPNGSTKDIEGATYVPKVVSTDDSCTLSWTNDKGLPNPDPVDIKGKQGPHGESGVWVSSEDMPDDYNVQIDIEGDADEINYTLSDADREIIAQLVAEKLSNAERWVIQ